jgi:hypothetical protein
MQRSETQPQLVMSLSEEELFVALKLLQAPMIAGIDLSKFHHGPNERSTENVLAALGAAFKALVARGYLIPLDERSEHPLIFAPSEELRNQPWTHVSLRQEVQALVGTSASAARSLLLSWHTTRGNDLLYVHERDGLFVVNTSPLAGVYTFTALASWEETWQIIASKLTIQEQMQPEPPLPTIKLRPETLTSLREKSSSPDDLHELYTRLTQAGVSHPTAQVLLEALNQVLLVANVQMMARNSEMHDRANGRKPQQFSLVITKQASFVVDHDETGEMLLMRQATAQEIEERVHALWSKTPV